MGSAYQFSSCNRIFSDVLQLELIFLEPFRKELTGQCFSFFDCVCTGNTISYLRRVKEMKEQIKKQQEEAEKLEEAHRTD